MPNALTHMLCWNPGSAEVALVPSAARLVSARIQRRAPTLASHPLRTHHGPLWPAGGPLEPAATGARGRGADAREKNDGYESR
jgi:hypothetical protein